MADSSPTKDYYDHAVDLVREQSRRWEHRDDEGLTDVDVTVDPRFGQTYADLVLHVTDLLVMGGSVKDVLHAVGLGVEDYARTHKHLPLR